MSKTTFVRARIEPSLKEETENILKELGLSVSEAITLFYKQIIFKKGIPFEVRLPNQVTIEAMKDALEDKDLNNYSNLSELISKFSSEAKSLSGKKLIIARDDIENYNL
jgi:DNA-damage-inducible protein J